MVRIKWFSEKGGHDKAFSSVILFPVVPIAARFMARFAFCTKDHLCGHLLKMLSQSF